jgi:hypothetical protein
MLATTTRLALVLCLSLALVATARAQQKATETLAPNEQKSFQPGYAVGDIAIGNPKVADFKVLPGRRELLLFGKADGQTTLTIWDQQRNKRTEMVIVVKAAADPQIERELKALLQDFPSVEVQTLGGQPILTGAVSSKDDLAAIEKIAAAAKVRSLVRFVPPAAPLTAPPSSIPAPPGSSPIPSAPPASGSSASASPAPAPARGGAAPATVLPSPATPSSAQPPVGPYVEYEIELLEASSRFRSGSYATGIEPSGRRLYLGKLVAPIGADGEVFIGGKAVTGKDKTKTAAGTEQGIRLTLRPQTPDSRGRFKTGVLVQTNLPIGTETYDPESWRRARWEFSATSGEPFGITGSDLMASPDLPAGGGSAIGSVTRGAAKAPRIPGVSVPGSEYVPVFGSLFGSSSYKQKQSQLLVIIRPRLVGGGA